MDAPRREGKVVGLAVMAAEEEGAVGTLWWLPLVATLWCLGSLHELDVGGSQRADAMAVGRAAGAVRSLEVDHARCLVLLAGYGRPPIKRAKGGDDVARLAVLPHPEAARADQVLVVLPPVLRAEERPTSPLQPHLMRTVTPEGLAAHNLIKLE